MMFTWTQASTVQPFRATMVNWNRTVKFAIGVDDQTFSLAVLTLQVISPVSSVSSIGQQAKATSLKFMKADRDVATRLIEFCISEPAPESDKCVITYTHTINRRYSPWIPRSVDFFSI
jgi:hypothetical protein